MLAVIVIVVLVVVAIGVTIVAYNGLVRRRNQVDNAWSQIDVQLKRRYDLIPNLVETVKGYASHERGTFEAVVSRGRTRSMRRKAATWRRALGPTMSSRARSRACSRSRRRIRT